MADPITIKYNVTGTKMLLENFRGLKSDLQAVIETAYTNTAAHFAWRVKENQLKMRDHTLKELAMLGHPYSPIFPLNVLSRIGDVKRNVQTRRNLKNPPKLSTIGGKSAQQVLGHDIMKVHWQNGNLRNSIVFEIKHISDLRLSARVGVQAGTDAEEYGIYVHFGTNKMIARPFLYNELDKQRENLKRMIFREFNTAFFKAAAKYGGLKKMK